MVKSILNKENNHEQVLTFEHTEDISILPYSRQNIDETIKTPLSFFKSIVHSPSPIKQVVDEDFCSNPLVSQLDYFARPVSHTDTNDNVHYNMYEYQSNPVSREKINQHTEDAAHKASKYGITRNEDAYRSPHKPKGEQVQHTMNERYYRKDTGVLSSSNKSDSTLKRRSGHANNVEENNFLINF